MNIKKSIKSISVILGVTMLTMVVAENQPVESAKDALIIKQAENFTDSRDGQVYPTVQIGNQVWMTKNLAYKAKGSFAYKNDEKNVEKYGRLYLWDSLKTAIPKGWHLATDTEWQTLEKNLGMTAVELAKSGYEVERGSDQGKQLKVGGRTMMDFPMAGFRRDDGKFEGGDDDKERPRTYLWVNTKIQGAEGEEVFRRRLQKDSDKLYRFTNPTAGFAVSVRLLKDTQNATDLKAQQQLEANKKLVVDFYNEVLFRGDYNAMDKYIGDVYIQHNPQVADGKKALFDILKQHVKNPGKEEPSGKIVRVIAEGDLVVLHVHNFKFPAPRGSAVVDIFRVKDGKIVEHWDVGQDIPEKMAHDNGMF